MKYSATVTIHLTSKTGICGVSVTIDSAGIFEYSRAQFAYPR